MTILIDSPKSVFVHVPKNAGTSISLWLRENTSCQNVKRKHDTYEAIKHRYGNDLGFSFAVVRNPWDRVVSAFHYNKKMYASGKYEHIEENIGKRKNGIVKKKYETILKQKLIIEKNDFKLFVKSMMLSPVEKTQVQMCDEVDLILRYENLEEEFKQIQDFFGINKNLPIKNTSSHNSYQSYYDDVTMQIVHDYYKEDIIKFGYSY